MCLPWRGEIKMSTNYKLYIRPGEKKSEQAMKLLDKNGIKYQVDECSEDCILYVDGKTRKTPVLTDIADDYKSYIGLNQIKKIKLYVKIFHSCQITDEYWTEEKQIKLIKLRERKEEISREHFKEIEKMNVKKKKYITWEQKISPNMEIAGLD